MTVGAVIEILAANPLLLLFGVAAIGFPLGRISVGGIRLGAAAVLFVGIAVGSLDRRLQLPPIIFQMGLAILVYTIGLASAQTFFSSLDRQGLRRLLIGLMPITLAAIIAYFVALRLGIRGAEAAGMFAGAFTNASGLASVVDALEHHGAADPSIPVIAYSMAYPLGILTPMLVIYLARTVFRVDLAAEALTIPAFRRQRQAIEVATVEVTRPDAVGVTIAHLVRRENHEAILGRVRRRGVDEIVRGDLSLQMHDAVTVIGPMTVITQIAETLGRLRDRPIELEESEFDTRRLFVSRPEVTGRPLKALRTIQEFGGIVTRVRRGDLVFLPNGSTVLELGDRVRVLTRRDRVDEAIRFFGDSYRRLAEADLLTLCFGIGLGCLLGLVPIPIPGGEFRLGFSGGPLIMALILGKIARTGSIVWAMPYSANLTLRQFGLMLFSAGIGLRAGFDFVDHLRAGEGWHLLGVGVALTFISGIVTMAVGYGMMRIPLNYLFGIYAGAQTQPMTAAFAADQTGNDLPTGMYAALFPVATVFKIILGQALLIFLR